VPTILEDGDVVTFGKSVGRDNDLVRPVSVRVRFVHSADSLPSGGNSTPARDYPSPSHVDDGADGAICRSNSGRYGLHVPDTFSSDGSSSSDHDSDIEEISPPAPALNSGVGELVEDPVPSYQGNLGGTLPSLQGLGLLAPRCIHPLHRVFSHTGLSSRSFSSHSSGSDHVVDTSRLSFPHSQEQALEDDDEVDEVDSLYDAPTDAFTVHTLPPIINCDSQSSIGVDSIYGPTHNVESHAAVLPLMPILCPDPSGSGLHPGVSCHPSSPDRPYSQPNMSASDVIPALPGMGMFNEAKTSPEDISPSHADAAIPDIYNEDRNQEESQHFMTVEPDNVEDGLGVAHVEPINEDELSKIKATIQTLTVGLPSSYILCFLTSIAD
jgi:hypothetical protein